MGQIKLSPAAPSFPSAPLQAAPTQPKSSLPPAELSKQLSPTECFPATDQNQLKNLSAGTSKTELSFLDDEPAFDLPSAKEFVQLMQEVEQANTPTPNGPAPGQRRTLDESVSQNKASLDKIRQAASQEPKSAEAVKMLWLLEEQNKVSQGYEYENGQHALAFGRAIEDTLKNAGIDPKPAPKENQLSPAESGEMLEKLKRQLANDNFERTKALLDP